MMRRSTKQKVEKVLRLCQELGISIQHQDDQGAFIIRRWEEKAADWLRDAEDETDNKPMFWWTVGGLRQVLVERKGKIRKEWEPFRYMLVAESAQAAKQKAAEHYRPRKIKQVTAIKGDCQ